MAGEGRRFLKEGMKTPKQMGNDKRKRPNIQTKIHGFRHSDGEIEELSE